MTLLALAAAALAFPALAQPLDPTQQDLQALRDRGYSWTDVGKALVIADQAGRGLGEVAGQHDQGLPWDDVASRYGVRFVGPEDVRTPVAPAQGPEPEPTTPMTAPDLREAPNPVTPQTNPPALPPGGADPSETPNAQPGPTPTQTP